MTARLLGFVVAVACRQRDDGGNNKSQAFGPGRASKRPGGNSQRASLPGAMVLLRTPKGEFAFGYGLTELGTTAPPRADTHFSGQPRTPKR
jgi:hypothetical protein